jgi:hypothetical protein
MYTNRNLFRQTGLQKCGKVNIVFWITAGVRRIFELTLTYRNPNPNCTTLWRIFQQIKVRQPIGRKDSIQTKQCAKEAGGWRIFCI